MAIGYFLRVGDKTTCGGQILTGDNTFIFHGRSAARQGDLVTCGKHSGTYNILGGVSNVWGNGRMMAGTLDSFSSCPCKARLINSITDCYSKEDEPMSRAYNPVASEPPTQQPISQPSNHYASPIIANDNNKIRIDAQHLIDCADELCEKHLYYPDIKNAFQSQVEAFAYLIVDQVESGQKSYEQGSAELKQEEKSLLEQSLNWLTNGLSIFGGVGMVWAGGALCGTGLGCIIGAPLIAHGANGIYEGVEGLVEGRDDIDGPLRKGYQIAAKELGFNESVGNLTYDLIDLGISVHGKLKLVPKLNEFGDPKKNLFIKEYARQDLEKAYKQMSDKLLSIEILSDTINLFKIKDDIQNAFLLDQDSNNVMMVVAEPQSITNVKDIVENCELYIVISNNDENNSYYKCTDDKGNEQKYHTNGDIMK
ncbi:DUF4225 domain-containing protein [Providencia stuartii]|uniref:DUF4225 domain-containing protein n=1 Tax=Providencia rettgeri TaxID=587 RepID=A0AB35LCD7_PRORE|nr:MULTISPECIES: DUF4225 domain-containing protein [Providencia]EMD1719437.1 DUF4225 domain-containing protein [Providencia stuartii]MBG5910018.1 DUF4225 domain-containing protein [Providencia stuartii]MDH2306231.1 DUF4225 domain-containing protein [Providencia rettgeri]WAZ74418.1 DUF4225 domain-containing protein [Providencia stuartii]HAU5734971.1 DUF4225 domain-containing protein [Providencia stuartii]